MTLNRGPWVHTLYVWRLVEIAFHFSKINNINIKKHIPVSYMILEILYNIAKQTCKIGSLAGTFRLNKSDYQIINELG